MELTAFWAWWVLTIAVCAVPLVRAARNSWEAMSFPVIASLMWLYLYVYLSFHFTIRHAELIPLRILTLAQALPCLCFGALLLGWYSRAETKEWVRIDLSCYETGRLWTAGIVLMAIGLIARESFVRSGHSFRAVSAYWYMPAVLAYSGIVVCTIVLTTKRRSINAGSKLLFALLFSYVFLPPLINARRGPTFAALVGAAIAHYLVRNAKPSLVRIGLVIICSGGLMLFLVTARQFVYQGKTWTDVLSNVQMRNVSIGRAEKTSDNEFANHCIHIWANVETGRYQYGTAHLQILAHWIPRSWWAGKPARDSGIFPAAMAGFEPGIEHNLGTGGAWATVADTFDNYWFLCLPFWAVLGRVTSVVHWQATQRGSLHAAVVYIGMIMSSHWLIAQCLQEASVPFLFMLGGMLAALRLSRQAGDFELRCVRLRKGQNFLCSMQAPQR